MEGHFFGGNLPWTSEVGGVTGLTELITNYVMPGSVRCEKSYQGQSFRQSVLSRFQENAPIDRRMDSPGEWSKPDFFNRIDSALLPQLK